MTKQERQEIQEKLLDHLIIDKAKILRAVGYGHEEAVEQAYNDQLYKDTKKLFDYYNEKEE